MVRDLLADDLGELAGRVAARWGDPFGDAHRVLLLCSDVHRWSAPPSSGVGFLLEMLDDPTSGLGRPDRPSPVVFTASGTEDDGKTVADWCEKARKGLRWHQMEDLTRGRAGRRVPVGPAAPVDGPVAEDPELYGRSTHPCAMRRRTGRQCCAAWAAGPTVVEDRLYVAANLAFMLRRLRRDDDELAWTQLRQEQPGVRAVSTALPTTAEELDAAVARSRRRRMDRFPPTPCCGWRRSRSGPTVSPRASSSRPDGSTPLDPLLDGLEAARLLTRREDVDDDGEEVVAFWLPASCRAEVGERLRETVPAGGHGPHRLWVRSPTGSGRYRAAAAGAPTCGSWFSSTTT